jgi:dephospho-CoA kinase
MLIIGLTGSIGMGKTATAQMFARKGVPVCDSDALVHGLYEKGGAAVAPVTAAFPDANVEGCIDREVLSRLVLGQPEQLKRLERIVHPLVGMAQAKFMQDCAARGERMVVLDIPLLLEAGGPRRVDVIVVVSAPAAVQRARVLARPGMTAEKFEAILAKQVPDGIKREKADFVIDTSRGFEYAEKQVDAVIQALAGRKGEIWVAL